MGVSRHPVHGDPRQQHHPQLGLLQRGPRPGEQLEEGENQLSDGNRGIGLSTVDAEPVSHDDCQFYEGMEFVFPRHLHRGGRARGGHAAGDPGQH